MKEEEIYYIKKIVELRIAKMCCCFVSWSIFTGMLLGLFYKFKYINLSILIVSAIAIFGINIVLICLADDYDERKQEQTPR